MTAAAEHRGGKRRVPGRWHRTVPGTDSTAANVATPRDADPSGLGGRSRLTKAAIGVSVLALLIAAVPLLLLDPQADDGAATLVALVGVPMLVPAALIEIARRGPRDQSMGRAGWWWLLAVLPLGIAALAIPTILQNAEYFEATSWGSVLGTLALMLVLVYVGLLLGFLFWFFVVFPLSLLVGAVVSLVRGERPRALAFVIPVSILLLTGVILVGAMSLDDLLPGRFASGQIVMAILGIPGSYDVTWEAGLWIVRGLVIAVVLLWIVPEMRERRRRAA